MPNCNGPSLAQPRSRPLGRLPGRRSMLSAKEMCTHCRMAAEDRAIGDSTELALRLLSHDCRTHHQRLSEVPIARSPSGILEHMYTQFGPPHPAPRTIRGAGSYRTAAILLLYGCGKRPAERDPGNSSSRTMTADGSGQKMTQDPEDRNGRPRSRG